MFKEINRACSALSPPAVASNQQAMSTETSATSTKKVSLSFSIKCWIYWNMWNISLDILEYVAKKSK